MAFLKQSIFNFICLVHFVALGITSVGASRILREDDEPSDAFRHFERFTPYMVHDRAKRHVETRLPDGHLEELSVVLESFGQTYTIDLQRNRDLLPEHHFERHHQDGKVVVDRPFAQNRSHCYYKGRVRGVAGSWAALSTCRGLSGAFFDGKELHYVEPPADTDGDARQHFIYKHSHLRDTNWTCGYQGTPKDRTLPNFRDVLPKRFRRSSEIHGPYNSNSRSRYVELVLVNDKKLFEEMKGNKEAVFARSKDIANIANALYASLNIFIALVGVVVWSDSDEITLSPDGDTTLTNFLHYRRLRLVQEHPNDNAQLVTGVAFNGGVVGKALKGPICTYEYSGGVNMDHNPVVGLVATTVAHELGHNFGMEHDDDDCFCPEEKCIMAPASSQTSPTHWSSCSHDYLKLAFEHGMDYCLRNKPDRIVGPVCGNGFVEPGEQCDCGLRKFCDNSCCNATSCTLFANATCATGLCCDLSTCGLRPVATPCRPADGECDLPEYCDGLVEFCPADVHKQDGFSCKGGRAFCFHGQCRSHTDQCRLLWGSSGQMSDRQCFEYNRKGTANGNCGYFRVNQTYKSCSTDDTLCGMLHCTHLNERLEFGMESVAILSRSFITEGDKVLTCRSAIVDLGLNSIDPGLAPDGARCGEDKVCVNQRCLSVGSLRVATCAGGCNGNGVCNSRGHCHCATGYAPPLCDYPGPGGSDDSGPATDPDASYYFTYAMYIIFLAIVPAMAIAAFVFYYYRGHIKRWWIVKGHEKAISRRTREACQRRGARPPPKVIAATQTTTTTTIITTNAPAQASSIPAEHKANNLRSLHISGPLASANATSPTDGGSVGGNVAALTRAHSVKAAKLNLDRHSLRNLEISAPIPQVALCTGRTAPVPMRPAPPLPTSPQQDRSMADEVCPPSWRASMTGGRGAGGVSRSSSAAQDKVSQGGSTRLKRLSSSSFSRPTNPPPRPPPPRGKSGDEDVSPTAEGIYESVIYSDGSIAAAATGRTNAASPPSAVPSSVASSVVVDHKKPYHQRHQDTTTPSAAISTAPGFHMSKFSHTYAQPKTSPKTSALANTRQPASTSANSGGNNNNNNSSSGGMALPKMGTTTTSSAAGVEPPQPTRSAASNATRANMGASSLVNSLAKRFETASSGSADAPSNGAASNSRSTAVQGKDSFRGGVAAKKGQVPTSSKYPITVAASRQPMGQFPRPT